MIGFLRLFGFVLVMLALLPVSAQAQQVLAQQALAEKQLAVGEAQAEIVVAVPAPLAGARGAMGLAVHTAALIAAAEINAQGGIGGRPIRLELHDDPCSAESLTVVRDIIASAAQVVIGHPCASSVQVAAPLYRAAGKLFLTAGSIYPRRVGATELRLPHSQAQADALARVLVAETKAGVSRVAIVRDKTKLNIALALPVERALRAAGVTVVSDVFAGGDKDFSALARRLAAGGVTHVALMAFTIEGALIAADVVKALPGVEIFGPDQLGTPDFGALAGPTAAERVRILLPASAALYGARHEGARVLAGRMAGSGAVATREALETAAALQAWAAAAQAATDLTAARVIERLAEPHATLLGALSFDRAGDASLPFWTLHRWRDGAFRPVP